MTATGRARVRVCVEDAASPAASLALAEIRGKCRLDGGHWLWAGSHHDGYPRIWAPDFTNHAGAMMSQHGKRAVWHTLTGKAIPKGWRVFGTCGERGCVNPEHLECVPPSVRGAKVAASGKLKGVMARIIANRTTVRKHQAKITPELMARILASTDTGEKLSADTGLNRTTISRVRNGKIRIFDAVGGVFGLSLAGNDSQARRSA